ncbi:hypothetical protein [Propionivibrio soli]|uniref:hypothetical protein n=1 Tax=Propionivibrio soli TaxID=2976531 RepID=UPI0021E96B62|nr:hypothetical protein [Propionivibrio soli]
MQQRRFLSDSKLSAVIDALDASYLFGMERDLCFGVVCPAPLFPSIFFGNGSNNNELRVIPEYPDGQAAGP